MKRFRKSDSASGFFASTRFVATSRMSEGARSTRQRKRSCMVARRILLESIAATTSSSFSCEVTMIQQGAGALRFLTRLRPTLPNSSTVARRSSILSLLRATCWPTSSMMNAMALPGRRRLTSSKVRSTTVFTVMALSRVFWVCAHESGV